MTPILLTLTLVGLSNLVALPLGVAWGWALDELEQPSATQNSRIGKSTLRLFSQALLASLIGMLAIPLYIHAAGWESAAGKFGWLPILQGGPRFWFSGIWAAAWIHSTYGACWIAIATWWGLRRRPRAIDNCARLDTEAGDRKWLVDLPLVSGWILVAVAWNSVLAATEMTVADLYAVSTLSDIVYKVYALDPQPMPVIMATLLPAMLVVPVILWLLSRSGPMLWTLRGTDVFGTDADKVIVEAERDDDRLSDKGIDSLNDEVRTTVRRRLVPGVTAIAITLLVGFVPLFSLVAKAGWTVTQVGNSTQVDNDQAITASPIETGASSIAVDAVQPQLTHSFELKQVFATLGQAITSFQTEIAWTAQLAMTAILFAMPISLLLAALAESRPSIRTALLMLMLLLAMIPGPVISLYVIQFFNRPSLSLLYDRSLIPSVFAVLPRAIPAGYLVLRTGYRMLDRAVLDCAALDGLGTSVWGTLRRVWLIDGPRLWRPILFAAICILLIACGDLSATLLVLPPSVSTIASRLFGLLHSGVRHQEAGLALLAAFCIGCVSVPLIRLVR